MDFEPVKRAKLKQEEFGRMCGVSRVTVNMWLNNKMQPHRFLKANVTKRLQVLSEALSVGDLPLPEGLAKSERERRLFTIMRNTALRMQERAAESPQTAD